jgi:hypothetical protein
MFKSHLMFKSHQQMQGESHSLYCTEFAYERPALVPRSLPLTLVIPGANKAALSGA